MHSVRCLPRSRNLERGAAKVRERIRRRGPFELLTLWKFVIGACGLAEAAAHEKEVGSAFLGLSLFFGEQVKSGLEFSRPR